MIHEKIRGAVVAINALAGQVSEEAWNALKCARAELADAADMAEAMEERIPVSQLAGFAPEAREAAHG